MRGDLSRARWGITPVKSAFFRYLARYTRKIARRARNRSARLAGKASPLFQLNGLDDSWRPTNACREDATVPIKLFIDPLLSDRKIVPCTYIRGDNKATRLLIFYCDRPILIKRERYHLSALPLIEVASSRTKNIFVLLFYTGINRRRIISR